MNDHGGGGGCGALLEDLEQMAVGLALAERDGTVAELASAAEAEVRLLDRLHGSIGRRVKVTCAGGHRLEGTLERVGTDLLILRDGGTLVVVRVPAVLLVDGLGSNVLPETARPLTARLGLGSVLRRVVTYAESNVIVLVDRSRVTGRIVRVGADFIEVLPGDGGRRYSYQAVSLDAVATVRIAS